MNKYDVFKEKNIRKLGRTPKNANVFTLFWSGSGIEFNIRASEAWLEVYAEYEQSEHWIRVIIDDETVIRMPVVSGTHKIPLFRRMNGELVKKVRVVTDTQAKTDDEESILQFVSLETDGELQASPEHKYRIEVIGDSITSGEGAVGALCEQDWIPMFFSSEETYARILADKLDAELFIISQSGWGVYCSWDNRPECSIPQYYEQVCGVLKGEKNRALGSGEQYDFASGQTDAVIVFLGTNDESAMDQPAYTDPATGITTKLKADETAKFKTPDKETENKIYKSVLNFLKLVRKNNPDAYILWLHGYFGRALSPVISRAVGDYVESTGDKNTEALELEPFNEEDYGARSHPGKKAHKKIADRCEIRLRAHLTEKERK